VAGYLAVSPPGLSNGHHSGGEGESDLRGQTEVERIVDRATEGCMDAITDTIKTDAEPQVFDDTNLAINALQNGQIDGIVVDLPTAFYVPAVQLPKATIVGQFQPETGEQEEFGLLFEKGNPLVTCANQALATLKSDGTLAALEKKWLSDVVNVPTLK